MKVLIKTFLFVLLIMVSQRTIAQIADTTQLNAEEKEKTKFTVGGTFSSKLHYYGRTDSLKSTAFIPELSVQFANGIYISSSFIFINNSQRSFDYTATIAEAGYKFGQNKKKGLAGSVYADKFFYANNQLVRSSQQGQAGFALSWLNKIADINAGSSVVFSDNPDFFASLGFDHPFRKEKGKNIFVIVPTITANAGSQNFTHTYFVKRNVLLLPAADEQLTKTSKNFKLLSYEASVPIVFVRNKMTVTFTPGYVLPQSVIKVAGRPDLSETASNLFYANLGVSFTFGKK